MLAPFILGSLDKTSTGHLLPALESPGSMLLSLWIIFLACHIAFYVVQPPAVDMQRFWHWSTVGAIAILSTGLWATHCMGLLSIAAPAAGHDSTQSLGTSFVLALATAIITIFLWRHPQRPLWQVMLAALAISAGLVLMHSGEQVSSPAALPFTLDIQPFIVAVCAGLVFTTLAFSCHRWILQHHLLEYAPYWRWVPPSILALAFSSMHYTLLYAMHADASHSGAYLADPLPVSPLSISLVLTLICTALFTIVLLAHLLQRSRMQAQQFALRNTRLKAMLETVDSAFISTNDQGVIQEVNATAIQLFGYTREEVIGHNVKILMPSPLAEQQDTYFQHHLLHISKPLENGLREVLGRHKDGRLIPLQLTLAKVSTPLGLTFVGYLQDISIRKRTDAQLRIAANVFHHVQEGIVIIDAHYNISETNTSFERLMGGSKAEYIGRPLSELYEDAHVVPDMHSLRHALTTARHWRGEAVFARRNATPLRQRISITPVLNENQRPHHFIAIISDSSSAPSMEDAMPHRDLHDSATGLPNHILMVDRINHGLINSSRHTSCLAVMCLQLLSDSNSNSERSTLDPAMRQLAQLLQRQLRWTDTLARYSKDQLVIVLPGIRDAEAQAALIRRLEHTIEHCLPHLQHSNLLHIHSLSLGYASTLETAASAAALIDTAKKARRAWELPCSALK